MMYVNNRSKKFSSEKHKNRSRNIVPLKPPACLHVNFLNPRMYLEPPISKILKNFSNVSVVFFMTDANNWSKKSYAKKHRNGRQNNFPLKAPACVHTYNFFDSPDVFRPSHFTFNNENIFSRVSVVSL